MLRERMGLREEHQTRHEALDESLMELWEDFARHFPNSLPQQTTVGQLMVWSRGQAVEPTDPGTHAFFCAHCGERVEDPDSHECEGEGGAVAGNGGLCL